MAARDLDVKDPIQAISPSAKYLNGVAHVAPKNRHLKAIHESRLVQVRNVSIPDQDFEPSHDSILSGAKV
jgi:hypothetical protein